MNVPPFVFKCSYGYFMENAIIAPRVVEILCEVELSRIPTIMEVLPLRAFLGSGRYHPDHYPLYLKILLYRLEHGT